MAQIDLNNMDDTYYDILRELGNIGAGNAVTALSVMLSSRIDMSVPKVAMLDFKNVTELMGSEETLLVGILFMIEGDVNGMMMFLLDRKSARLLVNELMMTKDKTELEFDNMELSAVKEVANIISGAYVSSLSTLTNLKMMTSVPSLNIDMAGALLSVPAIEFGKIGDKVLLIQTNFGETSSVNGYFLLIPDLPSYNKILSSLGM